MYRTCSVGLPSSSFQRRVVREGALVEPFRRVQRHGVGVAHRGELLAPPPVQLHDDPCRPRTAGCTATSAPSPPATSARRAAAPPAAASRTSACRSARARRADRRTVCSGAGERLGPGGGDPLFVRERVGVLGGELGRAAGHEARCYGQDRFAVVSIRLGTTAMLRGPVRVHQAPSSVQLGWSSPDLGSRFRGLPGLPGWVASSVWSSSSPSAGTEPSSRLGGPRRLGVARLRGSSDGVLHGVFDGWLDAGGSDSSAGCTGREAWPSRTSPSARRPAPCS